MKPMNIPTTRGRTLRVAFTGFIIASFALLARVDAAAPLAGTLIGNQASATYKDQSLTVRTVLSNTVVTEVLQVNAFTLAQDNDRSANAGSQVFFPHTVTNMGNGPDTYTLAAADLASGDVFDFGAANIKIYIDANGDGNPDNYTPITTTGMIPAGGSFRFVVAATVPTNATPTQTGKVAVTATSSDGSLSVITNTDTATVTTGAVMEVTKAASQSSGKPGDSFIYTITYRNNGVAAASQLKITDIIPAGLNVGVAKWSVTPGSDLTSATLPPSVSAGSIAYNLAGQTATFVIGEVGPGVSGFVTIAVTVATAEPPKVVNNTAKYNWPTSGLVSDQNSNTVPFEILPTVALTFTGPPSPAPAVPAGGSVLFANTLTNNGTGSDTFNVVVDTAGLGTAGKFPAGTTFQLLKSDQATPLTDTDGDGIVDTGPVIAGATYVVYLKANIPAGAATTADDLSVTKTAISKVDPTKTATATDTIDGITGAGVDLRGAGATDGQGAGTNTVINTVAGNPGSTVTITLNVDNTGPNPDTFSLLADKDSTFGTVNDLPTGYALVFKDSSGTVITNTGVIAAGGTKAITVEITIPSGATPADVDFYFQAKSPSSGATDYLRDQVKVNTVRGITLATNNSGQTFPGGSVLYQHTLTNIGNVTEGQTAGASTITIALADSLVGSGFTSVVYHDVNGNGLIDAGEPIVPISGGTALLSSVKGTGITPGESIKLVVKVQAPIGAADGTTNVTTLTVTTANDINSVTAPAAVANTDTTNVITGNLTIIKAQSVDGGVTWTQANLTAKPGDQIRYKITVTNVGAADAADVHVNDTVPANTTLDSSFTATVSGGSVNTVGGTAPALDFNVGTLAPAAVATIEFAVIINN